MSKKQIHSRLDTLFSALAREGTMPDQADPGDDADLSELIFPKKPNGTTASHPVPDSKTYLQSAGQQEFAPFVTPQVVSVPSLSTKAGSTSLKSGEIFVQPADGEDPATIAVPLHMQGVGDLILELIDDTDERKWSEDDQLLVAEVSAQLTLALDNAQLYLSVQQELSERIRAEQAILRRNKDLAALNQTGQQLSHLASRGEIFELLARMVGEVLEPSSMMLCSYSTKTNILSFPICRENGQAVDLPDRKTASGIPDYVIYHKTILLITADAENELIEKGIVPGKRIPASLLAIPMIAGDAPVGAIVVQDFQKENAFDSLHAELLSTAASQAATAIENTDLFEQMQAALKAIENREQYQASVARSAAILTELGTQSLPEVLKLLGLAAQSSRVYFAEQLEDERGTFWASAAEWVNPATAYRMDKSRTLYMPVRLYSHWTRQLREKGWVITQANIEESAETELLGLQQLDSSLLIAVESGKTNIPGFLAFDQLQEGHDQPAREWHLDEINALRVAANALSNTFVRESLLGQLQTTLDETESLYKASNRLALAGDLQEMVQAILSGTRDPEINRAVLLLFENDSYGKLARIMVSANWYSGYETPPPPVGTEYPRTQFETFLKVSSPSFIEDLSSSQIIDEELQESFARQHICSIGILPLWIGKRQIGTLLLQAEKHHPFTPREMRTFPPLVDQLAIAVENQRLFEQTQSALSETELLYSISNQIAQAGEASDLLGLVAEKLLPKGADRVSLMLINTDANGELSELELAGAYDAHAEFQLMGVRLPIASFPIVKSLTGEPLVIPDVHQHPLDSCSLLAFEQLEAESACLVPLRTSGALIGLLIVSAHSSVEYTPDEIRLLRIAGNGIAVALDKQRLLRQAQRRALELQTASEIARDTASTLSLDLLLKRITDLLSSRFGFDHVGIYLLDESKTTAVIREATGDAGLVMKNNTRHFRVGSKSVVGTVTASGIPLLINDMVQNQDFTTDPLLSDTRSEMGIPLKLGVTVMGALDLQSHHANAFTPDDITVLQILADQIAIAIENAQAYELSQKAIEDMKEIDRVKSQFLANMSHELRTPLNSIIGFSRVILKEIDGPVNEIQKQDLSAIYNSGQHLLSLINDILDLSKIEAGKMELSFSDVNVADMINSAMSTATGLVKDKPIQLKAVVPDLLPIIRVDNTRLRQVLINFLSNAAKFTDSGTILVEAVEVKGPHGRPEVMVTVTDSGPGIAEEDQGKLFLPFSQVDDSPTRKTGGTGLGLSICRSLIELHNGRIGLLRSEIGVGSTFFFAVPLPSGTIMDKQEGPETGRQLILAIDDDPKVIDLYDRYLRPHGYTLVPLTNPEDAVSKAKELQPYAITLDVNMPGKDGWQVLQELKKDPATSSIPVVVCSIQENQEKGFSLGAADYLVKPFLQEDLNNALNRLNLDGHIRDVMVIDDNAEDLRLIQKMLESEPRYRIITAQGGPEGWNAIQTYQPDAVILDLFMPRMNGFHILEKLRENTQLCHIPVLVLTGADLSADQHDQLTSFGQAVLSKGYLRKKELLMLLEEALRTYSHSTQTN